MIRLVCCSKWSAPGISFGPTALHFVYSAVQSKKRVCPKIRIFGILYH